MINHDFFVAHEFSKSKIDDLRTSVKKAFYGTGLKAYYADNEVRNVHILDKIKDKIINTDLGIYDISNPLKPNVFLELGIAMGAEKPFILICERGTTIPSDLAGYDKIEYSSYSNLTRQLKDLVVEQIKNLHSSDDEVLDEEFLLSASLKIHHANASYMRHGTGVVEDDTKANNGRAWYTDDSLPCPTHMLYGPYERLEENGSYEAVFKIKISTKSTIGKILHLDVYSNSDPSVNSIRTLTAAEFKRSNKYQLFRVPFNYSGQTDTEYRVIKLKQKIKVWIDYVSVLKTNH